MREHSNPVEPVKTRATHSASRDSERSWDHRVPSRLLSLPASCQGVYGVYWRPTPAFIDELAESLRGKRVLEVFAGNGYLAGLMAARGIDIVATSVLSSIDAHEWGIYHPVIDIDAVSAVRTLGDAGSDRDLLLMCWPTVTEEAMDAAQIWSNGTGRPIAFIGEFTDYTKDHLGGCATDRFFESFVPIRTLSSYRGNMLERACIGELKPGVPRDHET